MFRRKEGEGVREECLVFRFAHYLQNKIGSDFYVDCEYDSAYQVNDDGTYTEIPYKSMRNRYGEEHQRLVDIIVHTRKLELGSDFICFEFKKWNNDRAAEYEKDEDNLRELTHTYGYIFGFHVVLGRFMEETRWTIYARGIASSRVILEDQLVFS